MCRVLEGWDWRRGRTISICPTGLIGVASAEYRGWIRFEESASMQLNGELEVLEDISKVIVFESRTERVNHGTNSVTYAEQVIYSVRGH